MTEKERQEMMQKNWAAQMNALGFDESGMMKPMEAHMELNNPLTQEQLDYIFDVDFDDTNEIMFHTKNGKEVHFVKKQPNNGWISVKDRLPDMAGHMVLITAHNTNFNYDEVFPAFLSYGTNEWCTYDITKIRKTTPADNVIAKYLKVTHWMELPEPAKGE